MLMTSAHLTKIADSDLRVGDPSVVRFLLSVLMSSNEVKSQRFEVWEPTIARWSGGVQKELIQGSNELKETQ